MCILITFYKQRLNKQLQELVVQLQSLENKQGNVEPYPTVIQNGRFQKLNKKCQKTIGKEIDVSRSYAKWSVAEDNCLRERYKQIQVLGSLAKEHKRTPKAIHMRLKVLKVY